MLQPLLPPFSPLPPPPPALELLFDALIHSSCCSRFFSILPVPPSSAVPVSPLAFLGFSECQRKYCRVYNAPFWLQRDRSNRAFPTVLSLRPPETSLIYTSSSACSRLFLHPPPHPIILLRFFPLLSPRFLVASPISLPAVSSLLSPHFFRETTRPFNRVAFSLALPPPFTSVSPHSALAALFQYLRLSYSSLPPSTASYSRRSHSPHPLGELYPVNRGTLLVTVCNLTKDQTKRDLTYHPLSPPNPICSLVEDARRGKAQRAVSTWVRGQKESTSLRCH